MPPGADEEDVRRLRFIVGIAGGVYLLWWFTVQLLLPGAFNPFPGRLAVVALSLALLGASYRSRWVRGRLSSLFAAWACVLVAHYGYLVIGNSGDPAWWVGAFVTVAAASMCMPSLRETVAFSLFSLGVFLFVAIVCGELGRSIYLPGLATILLLANVTKRSQEVAQVATVEAQRARVDRRKADERRNQLAAIVESSGDAIVSTSLGGIIRSWNLGATQLLGFAADETVGRAISRLLTIGGRDDVSALLARSSRGERVPTLETEWRHKDGRALAVSVTMSPIVDMQGEVVGVSASARDISDRKRAEAGLIRAREDAENASRALEAFSYSVAHDLRAPLRAIDGFSHVLLEEVGPTLDAASTDYLHRVRGAAHHMGRLIDALLGLGRLARTDMQNELVDLSAIANAAAARLRESQPERSVEFVITEHLTDRGDPVLLLAAVDNLFDNAWKFTRHQSAARIEFGATGEGASRVYFVRDNGVGFDEAFASKLFVPFQRLHPTGEFEGNGVGLATVQRIVARHGGRIWAEGGVGNGACFYFTIANSQEVPGRG